MRANDFVENKTQRVSFAASKKYENELNDICNELMISRSRLLRNIVDNFKNDYYKQQINNSQDN
jgi:hypothetical protein